MISVLTWNVKMLPGPIGGGSSDLLRAKGISEAIVELDPDIVCLQEVFDEDIRDALFHYLSMTYGYIVDKGDVPWSIRQDSGLFLASKYPVNSQRFVPYLNSSGADSLAQKGVVGVTIDVQGDIIYVLNTHLQADYGDEGEYSEIRRKQVSKLAAVSSYQPYPTLVMGDMNILAEEDPGTPTAEYLRMMRLMDLRDLYREESTDPGYTLDKSNKRSSDQAEGRMDYIMASTDVTCNRTAVMRMYDLSDHFAVYAEVEV